MKFFSSSSFVVSIAAQSKTKIILKILTVSSSIIFILSFSSVIFIIKYLIKEFAKRILEFLLFPYSFNRSLYTYNVSTPY